MLGVFVCMHTFNIMLITYLTHILDPSKFHDFGIGESACTLILNVSILPQNHYIGRAELFSLKFYPRNQWLNKTQSPPPLFCLLRF